jgi:hypothetical protein
MKEETAHKCYTCQHQIERCFVPGHGVVMAWNKDMQFGMDDDGNVVACTRYERKHEHAAQK